MKTATVTWVTYNNYGTLLQAYALQQAVRQLGHENVILSDNQILREFRAARPKGPRPAPAAEAQTSRLGRLAADPGRMLRSILARQKPERYAFPYEGSQAACDAFRESDLTLQRDVAGEDLAALNEDYDAFLCGSDQIWSLFDYNFNPWYFLHFAQKRKIAYAPCLGTDRISDEKAEKLRELLADFSALSVREDVSARQLSALTGRDVQWVADPTLLHDRAYWENFAAEVPAGKKYLLCYFLENRQWYFDYARKLARKLGLRLLLIPSRWDHLQHSFVAKEAMGPREFAAAFRDAGYVLTDSYHGSIFSLIFEKDFRYLQRFAAEDPNSQNIRVDSLFGLLGLKDRMVSRDTAGNLPDMNYAELNEKLTAFRRKSWDFLTESLR